MKKIHRFITNVVFIGGNCTTSYEGDLQTDHLWRGIEVADGLVITGDVNYSLCNGLFNLGFWGGTNPGYIQRNLIITFHFSIKVFLWL